MGSLGEYIENKAGTIDDLDFQYLLQVPLLRAREIAIEDDQIDLLPVGGLQVQGLPLSDKRPGIPSSSVLNYFADDAGTRRFGKTLQFDQRLFYLCHGFPWQLYSHQQGYFLSSEFSHFSF
jgi:hypothetical protein